MRSLSLFLSASITFLLFATRLPSKQSDIKAVARENLNVFEEASIESRQISVLPKLARVEIFIISKNTNHVPWAYIVGDNSRGWVEKDKLSLFSEFKRISRFPVGKCNWCLGDGCTEMKFYPDGKYNYTYSTELDKRKYNKRFCFDKRESRKIANRLTMCSGIGEIFSHKDLYMRRRMDSHIDGFFFFENGKGAKWISMEIEGNDGLIDCDY